MGKRLVLKRFGIVKERARPDRLFLDLDLPPAFRRRRRVPARVMRAISPTPVVRAVCSVVGLHPLWMRNDRTRRGFHAVIALRERLTPAETVAMQALLGSDSRREALNLMRARSIRLHGAPAHFLDRWNLLFERKL